MVQKKVLLINKEKRQWWLDQKANGTLWEAEQEIFGSETDANKKGWKVDAVKVIFSESQLKGQNENK